MYRKLRLILLLTLIPSAFIFSQVANADSSKQLTEVQVIGRKPLVQSKGDKIIYNARADISNRSGTAADVLRKVPLVTVDPSGNVKMRGSAAIKVLLNGHPSGIMARSLKDALRMIPANTIESVEIITNPSAKYEAESATGIINIITKKKVVSTSGNLDLSAGNLERSIGGEFNVTREKFSMDLSVGSSREKQRNAWNMDRTTIENGLATGKLLQQTTATEYWKGLFGDLSVEFRPDSSQIFGFGISHWAGTFPSKSNFYNKFSEKDQPPIEYNQYNDQLMKFNSSDLSANYDKKFRKTGQSLELLGLYSHTSDNSTYTTLAELALNRSKNNELSFQADYTHPLNKPGKHLLETGIKYSNGKAASTYNVFTGNSAVPATDRSNEMEYSQHTFAAYISLQFKTHNNWTFRPGIRYENTGMGGRFEHGAPLFTRTFNNFFPSVLVSRQLNDRHSLKFNFSQRIRRPEIWDVNPFVNASDPQNRTAGNPALRPEITQTLELGHDYSATAGFVLNSSIYFTKNDNAIESLTTIDSLGISTTRAQNIASTRRLGSNISAALQPTDKLIITAGAEFYKASFKSDILKVNNSRFYYNANLNVTYLFPSDWTVNLYGDYNKGEITLQGYNSSYYTYKFSVRKELLNKKAALTLGINNPFQQQLLQRNYMAAPTFSSMQTNRYYNRSVVLSFNWKFGGQSREEGREKGKEPGHDRSMPPGKRKR
jgi:outer membrane receptor protein involved in Fe transport